MIEVSLAVRKTLMGQYRWGERELNVTIKADFKCEYCGRDFLASVDDYDSWHKDHICPTSKYPNLDVEDNLAASCKTCNFIKRDHCPDGNTREERIENARSYIQKKRAEKLKEIAEMRALIFIPPAVDPVS